MAENEVKKEKTIIPVNLWFIVFIIYLIFSVAFMYNQNQTILKLEHDAEVATENTQNIIKDLKEVLGKYDIPEQKQEEPQVELPTTPNGVYAGTATMSGDMLVNLSMTLTLAENNIATLSVVDGSGDSIYNGVYSIAEDTVNFTSDDGLTKYSFIKLDDNTLKLASDTYELTLVK